MTARFDEAKAKRAVAFMERLPQSKGRWANKPLKLMDWQKDIVRKVFGTVDEDGNRITRTVFIEVPRKNGKTTMVAALTNYLLFADGEQGAEVYGAAYTREQASLVFDIAAEMVHRQQTLAEVAEVVDYRKRIVYPKTSSVYRAISRDAAGSHGFNAHGVVFDEFHNQPDRELYDVLTTSMGAREQPLCVIITTAGYDRDSICWKLHEYAQKVEAGIVDDPSFLGAIYKADEEDDWTDPETWKKANPALGETIALADLRRECKKAQEIPSYENTFKRLHLNIWTTSESRFLSSQDWANCASSYSLEDLRGRKCYGGLDLAQKQDVSAFVLLFPFEDHVKTLARFWVPESVIEERTRKDGVPYAKWVQDGYLDTTPGAKIRDDYVIDGVGEWAEMFDVQEIAFDRWGSNHIVTTLSDGGMTMVETGQGYKDMSEPTKELAAMVSDDTLRHDGNPVLGWMADNLVVTEDPAANIKPDKRSSKEKVDGMVALIMALDRHIRNGPEKTSRYEDPGAGLGYV